MKRKCAGGSAMFGGRARSTGIEALSRRYLNHPFAKRFAITNENLIGVPCSLLIYKSQSSDLARVQCNPIIDRPRQPFLNYSTSIDNIGISASQISGHIRGCIGKLLDCEPLLTELALAISISNFRQTLSYN